MIHPQTKRRKTRLPFPAGFLLLSGCFLWKRLCGHPSRAWGRGLASCTPHASRPHEVRDAATSALPGANQ